MKRIQRKRTKGWKMQAESIALNGLPAISVTRPGRWGNPFKVGDPHPGHGWPISKKEAVELFEETLFKYRHQGGTMTEFLRDEITMEEILNDLAGKNLACWCKVGDPCHADVLLRIANSFD